MSINHFSKNTPLTQTKPLALNGIKDKANNGLNPLLSFESLSIVRLVEEKSLEKKFISANLLIKAYTFLNLKYLFDILYNKYIISEGLKLGFTVSKVLDKGIIELIGPFGLSESSYAASSKLRKLEVGFIPNYALNVVLGLILFLILSLSPFLFNSFGLASVK